MAITTVQCSQQHCHNTFGHDDSMSSDSVELMALENGWAKAADGTWRGCANPSGCSLVHAPETPAEPKPGLPRLLVMQGGE